MRPSHSNNKNKAFTQTKCECGRWLSPFLDQVVLQDVQTADHLTEHQDSVAPGLQFGQQLVDQHQLAGGLDHGLEGHVRHVRPV